jgi:hypothetical protein
MCALVIESSEMLKTYSVSSLVSLDRVSIVVDNFPIKLPIDNTFDRIVDKTSNLTDSVSELLCMQLRERDFLNVKIGTIIVNNLLSRRLIIDMNYGLHTSNMLGLQDSCL